MGTVRPGDAILGFKTHLRDLCSVLFLPRKPQRFKATSQALPVDKSSRDRWATGGLATVTRGLVVRTARLAESLGPGCSRQCQREEAEEQSLQANTLIWLSPWPLRPPPPPPPLCDTPATHQACLLALGRGVEHSPAKGDSQGHSLPGIRRHL